MRISKTVMLIHGAWLTEGCWDLFRKRYEAQGYKCLTPAWPFQDGPIAEQRRSPHPEFANLTIGKIVDHHEKLIGAQPPILMGHSFGGLFVQMLLDRGLGAAGVAAHLASNAIPPPVHVEEVIADRQNYPARDNLRLPPLTRELELDYTGLSFVVPQRVRFRYKLEGHDQTWQEPGTRRASLLQRPSSR